MRHQETYWTYKGPPTPELKDLPEGQRTAGFESLSPGYRRAIWRDLILRDAKRRSLADDIMFRLKIALIDGSLPTLDEYLLAFEIEDARRAPLADDAERLRRADDMHRQSEVQIAARETV